MRKSKSISSLRAVFKLTGIGVAATLVACGGGGGGGESAGSVTPGPIVVAPPPAVLDTSIMTSVPAATYAAGTGERVAYDLLNAERQRCGLGLLAQNTKLDSAAAAQLKYSISNNTLTHRIYYGQRYRRRKWASFVARISSFGKAPSRANAQRI